MRVQSKQLARTLVEHTDGKGDAEAKKIIKEFVKFLSDERLLGSWREIERDVHKVWKEKYGVSNVKIFTAHELTDEAEESINKLTKGADVTRVVDGRLIGGAVIRIDDKRIDGSTAGTLRRLKATLAS